MTDITQGNLSIPQGSQSIQGIQNQAAGFSKSGPLTGHGEIIDQLSPNSTHSKISKDKSGAKTDIFATDLLKNLRAATSKLASLKASLTPPKDSSKITGLRPKIVIAGKEDGAANSGDSQAFLKALSKVHSAQATLSHAFNSKEPESNVGMAKLDLIGAKISLLKVKKEEKKIFSSQDSQQLSELRIFFGKQKILNCESKIADCESKLTAFKKTLKDPSPEKQEKIKRFEDKIASLKEMLAVTQLGIRTLPQPKLPPPLTGGQSLPQFPTSLSQKGQVPERPAPYADFKASKLGDSSPPLPYAATTAKTENHISSMTKTIVTETTPQEPITTEAVKSKASDLSNALTEFFSTEKTYSASLERMEAIKEFFTPEEISKLGEGLSKTEQMEIQTTLKELLNENIQTLKDYSKSLLNDPIKKAFDAANIELASANKAHRRAILVLEKAKKVEVSEMILGEAEARVNKTQERIETAVSAADAATKDILEAFLAKEIPPEVRDAATKQVLAYARFSAMLINYDLGETWNAAIDRFADTKNMNATERFYIKGNTAFMTVFQRLGKYEGLSNAFSKGIEKAKGNGLDFSEYRESVTAFKNKSIEMMKELNGKKTDVEEKIARSVEGEKELNTIQEAIEKAKNTNGKLKAEGSKMIARTNFFGVLKKTKPEDLKILDKATSTLKEAIKNTQARLKDPNNQTIEDELKEEIQSYTRSINDLLSLDWSKKATAKIEKAEQAKVEHQLTEVEQGMEDISKVLNRQNLPETITITGSDIDADPETSQHISPDNNFGEVWYSLMNSPKTRDAFMGSYHSIVGSLKIGNKKLDQIIRDEAKETEVAGGGPSGMKSLEKKIEEASGKFKTASIAGKIEILQKVQQWVKDSVMHSGENNLYVKKCIASLLNQCESFPELKNLRKSEDPEIQLIKHYFADEFKAAEANLAIASKPSKSEMLMKLFETQFKTASINEKTQILTMVQQWVNDPIINSGENSPYVRNCITSMLNQSDFPPELNDLKTSIQVNLTSISPIREEPPKAGDKSFSELMLTLTSGKLKPESKEYKEAVAFIAADLSSPTRYYLSQLKSSEWDADNISNAQVKTTTAPNITALTQHTTNLTNLIIKTIADQKRTKDAGKIMGFFIDVQDAMLKETDGQNIDPTGALAIHSAFKKTWIENRLLNDNKAGLSLSHLAKLANAEKLFSIEKNYKSLRALTEKTGVEVFQVLYADMERTLTTNELAPKEKQTNLNIIEIFAKNQQRIPKVAYTNTTQTSNIAEEMKKLRKTPEFASFNKEFNQSKFDKEIGKRVDVRFPKS